MTASLTALTGNAAHQVSAIKLCVGNSGPNSSSTASHAADTLAVVEYAGPCTLAPTTQQHGPSQSVCSAFLADCQVTQMHAVTVQVGLHKAGRGGDIVQETRLWDEFKLMTYTMRKKEGLADYR